MANRMITQFEEKAIKMRRLNNERQEPADQDCMELTSAMDICHFDNRPSSSAPHMQYIQESQKSKVFPSFELPTELWQHICKLAVTEHEPVSLFARGKRRLPTQPPITKTCRFLQEACLPYYYSINLFYAPICLEDEPVSKVAVWLEAIGKENRRALRRLYAGFPWCYDEIGRQPGQAAITLSARWVALYHETDRDDVITLRYSYGYDGELPWSAVIKRLVVQDGKAKVRI